MNWNEQPGLGKRLQFETVRISSQHEKLNQLYGDLRRELERGARHNAIVCFGRMRDSLEAHFEVEDQVYFPAVHGFMPKHSELLTRLSSDHEAFRNDLHEIAGLLEAHEMTETGRLLEGLVARLLAHEESEDALMADIESTTGRKRGAGRSATDGT